MDWLQDLIDKAAPVYAAKYQAKYTAQANAAQQLGDRGYYQEGQAGVQRGAGVTPGMLILGGVVLAAVLLLQD